MEPHQELARYWLEKSRRALEAAERERAAADLPLAVNRVYYACFYALSAVLTADGMAYGKHSAVRSALHQRLVKAGRVTPEWGAFYDRAFDDRQEADYEAVAEFDDATVRERIGKAAAFVAEMKRLLQD
jgi:hypothetical protein